MNPLSSGGGEARMATLRFDTLTFYKGGSVRWHVVKGNLSTNGRKYDSKGEILSAEQLDHVIRRLSV